MRGSAASDARAEDEGAPRLVRTPMVMAPDIILDLIFNRPGSRDAAMLFDAIAADVEAGVDLRPAYIAPITVPLVYYLARGPQGPTYAASTTSDLLRLLRVAPLDNVDHDEALSFHGYEFEDALQFVTCRRVGAKFLVTRNDFGVKRAPVHRRTAAEMLPFFRK